MGDMLKASMALEDDIKPRISGIFSIKGPECEVQPQTNFSYDIEIQSSSEEEWYMNKLIGSRLIKALNQGNERHMKTRTLEDILMRTQEMWLDKLQVGHMELILSENRESSLAQLTNVETNLISDEAVKDTVHHKGCDVPNSAQVHVSQQYYSPSSISCHAEDGITKPKHSSQSPKQAQTLISSDEDVEIENMTIKEMQHFFKKAARKVSKGKNTHRCSEASTSFPPEIRVLSNNTHENIQSGNATPVSLDNALSMVGFELQIDSSASDSADSSDGFVPSMDLAVNTGISTADYNPVILLSGEKSPLQDTEDAEGGRLSCKKRKADCGIESLATEASKAEATQDEWTLEMWQSYHKQHSRQRKSKRCCSPLSEKPSDRLDKHRVSASPLIYSDSTMRRSLNSSIDIDWKQEFHPDSPPLHLMSTFNHEDSPNSSNKGLCTELSMDGINNGNLVNDQAFQGNDSPPCAFLAKPIVRLVLEDESELGGSKASPEIPVVVEHMEHTDEKFWSLTPCSKASTVISFKAAESSSEILSKVITDQNLAGTRDGPSSQQEKTIVSGKCKDVVLLNERGGGTQQLEERKDEDSKNGLASSGAALPELGGPTKDLLSRAKEPALSTDSIVEQKCKTKKSTAASESDNSDTKCYSLNFSSKSECVGSLKPKNGSIGESKSSACVTEMIRNNGASDMPVSLLAMETLDVEENQESAPHKPAKLPCKRKAISPLSREKLLQASNFEGSALNDLETRLGHRGLKKLPHFSKSYSGHDASNRGWIDTFGRKCANESSSPPQNASHKGETLLGSPCHNKDLSHIWKKSSPKPLHSKVSVSPSSNLVGTATIPCPQQAQLFAQKLSLVLNNSPSPPPQQAGKAALVESSTPVGLSPLPPAKGILRSSSQACQGACRCEECVSLRSRAEKASEFSQQQMHDIEGLAGKLIKELSTMRTIVEEKLLQGSRSQSPRSGLTQEQVKMATNNAIEMEETTRKWLTRMARDCNRYCKIMRMQQRRLTFADEAGGQLCHIKLFHSQGNSEPSAPTVENQIEFSKQSVEGSLSTNMPTRDGEPLLAESQKKDDAESQ